MNKCPQCGKQLSQSRRCGKTVTKCIHCDYLIEVKDADIKNITKMALKKMKLKK